MLIIKTHLKDILLFIFILFIWLFSGLFFKVDLDFYTILKLPIFTLPNKIISILWFIVYILITISVFMVSKRTKIISNNDYFYMLITNYLSNQLFMFFFFKLMSPFLGFIITTITTLSSFFLYLETKKISKQSSYFLIPYIIYSSYSFILMTAIYFMNF
ncbi:MAG: tryptophan-rich sensory protein [Bacilli bacterium]|nr:tryptophan-rich sensory protein [Bacilli bacterium]